VSPSIRSVQRLQEQAGNVFNLRELRKIIGAFCRSNGPARKIVLGPKSGLFSLLGDSRWRVWSTLVFTGKDKSVGEELYEMIAQKKPDATVSTLGEQTELYEVDHRIQVIYVAKGSSRVISVWTPS
jgi:hypothetical protein